MEQFKPHQYNEIDLKEFLKTYKNDEIIYYSNPGNAGDGIIACATHDLFESQGINYVAINTITDLESIGAGRVLFYGGGGNLVEGKYRDAIDVIRAAVHFCREIIVLPHTIYGFESFFLKHSKKIKLICREKVSYGLLSLAGLPRESLFLSPDLAFHLDIKKYAVGEKQGHGIASCMRIDTESRGFPLPADNCDISSSWIGSMWKDASFARASTASLAAYLSSYSAVKTDRLHVGILGALLGKRVELFPNNYYKIEAVYEYSLHSGFPNVHFVQNDHRLVRKDQPFLPTDLAYSSGLVTSLQEQMNTAQTALLTKMSDLSHQLHLVQERNLQLNQEINRLGFRIYKKMIGFLDRYPRLKKLAVKILRRFF